MPEKTIRVLTFVLCLAGILVVFMFQNTNLASLFFSIEDKLTRFLVNRAIRFVLNDALTIGLIYALFGERKFVIFSLWVQLAGMLLILLPYVVLKVNFPSYNGPMISYLHRLILNPTILMLLIPAFYLQRKHQRSDPTTE